MSTCGDIASDYRTVYRLYRELVTGPFGSRSGTLHAFLRSSSGVTALAEIPGVGQVDLREARTVRDAVRAIADANAIRDDCYGAALSLEVLHAPPFSDDLGRQSVYLPFVDRGPGTVGRNSTYALKPEGTRREERLVDEERLKRPWLGVEDALLLLALGGPTRATSRGRHVLIGSWDPLVALSLASVGATGQTGCVARIGVDEWKGLTCGAGQVRHVMLSLPEVRSLRAIAVEMDTAWLLDAYVPIACWFRQRTGLVFHDKRRGIAEPLVHGEPEPISADFVERQCADPTTNLAPPLDWPQPSSDEDVVRRIAGSALARAMGAERPSGGSDALDQALDAVTEVHLQLLHRHGPHIASLYSLHDSGATAARCAAAEEVPEVVRACFRHYLEKAAQGPAILETLEACDSAWRQACNGDARRWRQLQSRRVLGSWYGWGRDV